MKNFTFCSTVLIVCSFLACCNGQESQTAPTGSKRIVGGGCDGCELMYIGMPKEISSTDTSAGWNESGQKLIITGTVFQLNGRTPAPDVIIYYWQTDNNGYYSPTAGMEEQAKRHGHIRGWVKTDENGKYTIKTIRPAPYPNESIPGHIHLSIKEPNIVNEYYTDEICFDDDKLLIQHFKKYPQENRGGSGVVRVVVKDTFQIAEHDIILGLNIPNYPTKPTPGKNSGLSIGEDQPSFIPYHAYGPDKGTQTCPVCKYGRYHGIIYFVGNKPDWSEIKEWLKFLEQESVQRQKYLKAYFVLGNDEDFRKESRQKELEQIGKELNIKSVALTLVPSFDDTRTEAHLNKINPAVENTFIIYKHRSIVEKFIDLKPIGENFKMLTETLDKTKGQYFDLPEPKHD